MTTKFKNKYFEGERILFGANDLEIKNCVFGKGESPLKESRDVQLTDSVFTYKYPLWYSENVCVEQTSFETMARSGIWYTKNIKIANSALQAPKLFRRCQGVTLDHVHFGDAEETMWTCKNIRITDTQINGNYFGKDSANIYLEHVSIIGNYAFDGARNIEAHHCTFVTKDNFWNCENVTIYDSVLDGEYLAWNTKNLTLINCTIRSDQGLNYLDGLTMINCRLIDSDLVFEYVSDLNVELTAPVLSIKNPISGRIKVPEIGQLIMDENKIIPEKTMIECEKIGERIAASDLNQEALR